MVAGLIAAAQPSVRAQATAKVWRIGVLIDRRGPGNNDEAFLAGMRDLGYVEGRDFVMEYRWGGGQEDRLPVLAAELVALKVDVILAAGAQTVQAAKAATSSIPIVIAAVNDPVSRGFVESLAHPGGTITGLTLISEDVAALAAWMACAPAARIRSTLSATNSAARAGRRSSCPPPQRYSMTKFCPST